MTCSHPVTPPIANTRPIPLCRICQGFWDFHADNRWVYDRLEELARQARLFGNRDRIGIGMLFEILRWDRLFTPTAGTDPFHLNNNYRSRYARLIMARNPSLAGLFETRGLH